MNTRFTNLIEAIAKVACLEPSISDLGPSVGDDGAIPELTLGPSIGDDTNPLNVPTVTSLGPCVGDDGPQPPT
jgi:hypothetical protein